MILKLLYSLNTYKSTLYIKQEPLFLSLQFLLPTELNCPLLFQVFLCVLRY